jgi:hypothetical protein
MSLTPEIAPNDCPEPPGFQASLPTLILHEACQTAGGIVPLAKLLGVSSAALERWLEGEEQAPPEIYQACLEIVLLHDPEAELLSARRGSGSIR